MISAALALTTETERAGASIRTGAKAAFRDHNLVVALLIQSFKQRRGKIPISSAQGKPDFEKTNLHSFKRDGALSLLGCSG